jgi:isopentenyldiphosphate isomerase
MQRRCLREEMGCRVARSNRPSLSSTARRCRPRWSSTKVRPCLRRVTDRPQPNADEVESWRATTLQQVEAEVEADPSRFSAWFPRALAGLRPLEVTARATRALPAMDADD